MGDLLLEFTYSFRLWKSFPFSAWIASATFCVEPRSTNAKHLQPFWTRWTWRGLKSFRRHRISSSEMSSGRLPTYTSVSLFLNFGDFCSSNAPFSPNTFAEGRKSLLLQDMLQFLSNRISSSSFGSGRAPILGWRGARGALGLSLKTAPGRDPLGGDGELLVQKVGGPNHAGTTGQHVKLLLPSPEHAPPDPPLQRR